MPASGARELPLLREVRVRSSRRGALLGVLVEHLVEVADAEEDQRVGLARLDLPPLLHERGVFRRHQRGWATGDRISTPPRRGAAGRGQDRRAPRVRQPPRGAPLRRPPGARRRAASRRSSSSSIACRSVSEADFSRRSVRSSSRQRLRPPPRPPSGAPAASMRPASQRWYGFSSRSSAAAPPPPPPPPAAAALPMPITRPTPLSPDSSSSRELRAAPRRSAAPPPGRTRPSGPRAGCSRPRRARPPRVIRSRSPTKRASLASSLGQHPELAADRRRDRPRGVHLQLQAVLLARPLRQPAGEVVARRPGANSTDCAALCRLE